MLRQTQHKYFEKAVDILRKTGAAKAAKRAGKIAAEGTVASYIHGGGKSWGFW